MKRVTALIAICALAVTSGTALAGGFGKRSGERVGNEALSKREPQVRGFLFRPGGHRYEFEFEPYIRKNGPYGYYPDYDPRSFSERVLSDPRLPTTAPSAF